MPTQPRILITGAAGFIGSNLLRTLLKEQVEVHAIVKVSSDLWRIQELLPRFFLHRVDLRDFEPLQRIVREIAPSAIFHLGAHGASSRHFDQAEILLSNVLGTFNLLKATEDIDYDSLIHIGGSSEYGYKTEPMQECDRMEPMTFYGATKACATLLAEYFGRAQRKSIAIVRVFSAYGYFESPLRLIQTAITAALEGQALELTSGNFSRDFIFVEDVVEASILCWKKKIRRELINLGTGRPTTNEQVIAIIEELTGKPLTVIRGGYLPHPSDQPFWVADTAKAKRLLNWTPRHTLREGLQKTIAWRSHVPTSSEHFDPRLQKSRDS